MKKTMTALEAKEEAQKIAFAPIYFQAITALKQLEILPLISRNRKGISASEIADKLKLSTYGVTVLLEAAACAGVVEYSGPDKVVLTKTGFFINSDKITEVNLNFVNDVCYHGAKNITESILNGKPEGLKTIGNWKTIYEGLSLLPEKIKKSWFDFDHYYSDSVFPAALKVVFKDKPEYLFDLGGNTGKWAISCCEHDREVRVKILDLPGQLDVAKKDAESKGFQKRIDFFPINFLEVDQKIPEGADAIWMSQFLDCFSSEEIISILKNVRQASSSETNIYILEPFTDNQKFEAARYCLTGTSLYFTTMANGNSKMYSITAMKELVKKAGLKIVKTFALIGDSYHTILKCRKV